MNIHNAVIMGDSPTTIVVTSFNEVVENLNKIASFLVENGQSEYSQVILKLRAAGLFGERICADTISRSKLTFENIMAELHPTVRLAESDRSEMQLTFVEIKSWAVRSVQARQ